MATVENALESRISLTIRKSPYLHAHQLRFEAHEGRVVLRGIVNSYFHKQMAQEAVRRVEGVDQVENQLEVHWL
jgi:osmotically-inducible protein OsmY